MRTDYEQIAASVERLGEERDLLRTELSDTKVERDEARAEIEKLKAERDEAMGLMRESQRLAGEATQQALDSATRLGTMADAARGLLADLDNPEASLTWSCRECPRVSTCQAAGACYCDEHSPGGGWDTTYAAPLRALRTLLEGKS